MRFVSSNAALCLSMLGLIGASDDAFGAEVSFADRFKKYATEKQVVIQASPSDTLVIEEGTYFLDGRPLVLAAENVRIDGAARIISFNDDDRPGTVPGVAQIGKTGTRGPDFNCSRSGCPGGAGDPGGTGETGVTGRESGRVELDVKRLSGNGTLQIIANGQNGGQGQKGGKGGTGGQGGKGAKRSCGGFAGLDTKADAGHGGAAGQGGPRGRGGTGGVGGHGGQVVLSQALMSHVRAGKIAVSAPAGNGGYGGEAGEAGDGGSGNDGGAGNSCGTGGRGSGRGKPGPDGEASKPGEAGVAGRITVSNFGEAQSGLSPTTIDLAQYDIAVKYRVAWNCDETETVFTTNYCVPDLVKPELSSATLEHVEEMHAVEISTTPSEDGHCMSVAVKAKRQKSEYLACPRARGVLLLQVASSPKS
ncbi:hypothetical protein ELI25_29535 (plasmid) [Rhizobium ruizarguesonis]|uniref:hypothetical protein n=1 Tax=Rhizobium ruizarguesonis TaxID=2081791 RepID=UPI001030D3B5|nr:hypothetical protein [Rhizobium ruizarguesonis]TAW06614.1 hypothetical protein ELI25_29535 [Rhizobium ruizarguesonis]